MQATEKVKSEEFFPFDGDSKAWEMLFTITGNWKDSDCVDVLRYFRLRGLRLTREGRLDFSNFLVQTDGDDYCVNFGLDEKYKIVNPADPQIVEIRKFLYAQYGDRLADALKYAAKFVVRSN